MVVPVSFLPVRTWRPGWFSYDTWRSFHSSMASPVRLWIVWPPILRSAVLIAHVPTES